MTDDIFAALAAEFPREQVSWRAQNIKKDGTSALALAYIDSRDVMNRLDSVVGPANWSDSYDVHEHVTICTIAIRTADGWVSKADGAGDTDVEAEKGRLSDAFKRAAVKWQIGRYLYSIAAPWVECETYDTGKKDNFGNVKWGFKRWTVDPWSKVRNLPKPAETPHDPETGEIINRPERLSAYRAKTIINFEAILAEIDAPERTVKELQNLNALYLECDAWMPGGWVKRLTERIDQRLNTIGLDRIGAITGTENMNSAYAETMRGDPTAPKPLPVSPELKAQLDKLEADPGYGTDLPPETIAAVRNARSP